MVIRTYFLLAIAILLLTACTTAAEELKDEVEITALAVSGNFEVSDNEILSVAISKAGELLSTTKLEEDLKRIFDLGYFSRDVKATLSEYRNGARITFIVEENPVVAEIIFEGNKSYSANTLQSLMGTKRNKILNSITLRSDIEAIEATYHDAGFVAARVTGTRLSRENNLIIEISEGIIEKIRVEYLIKSDEDDGGSEVVEINESGKTKSYVITRQMKVRENDAYNTNIIGKDLQRIYNLGFFNDVHTRVEAGSSAGKIILVVEVEEADTGSIGFGGGYSSNTGITGLLSYTERNLGGKARKAEIELELGGKRNCYNLGYFEPWLDNKQTSIEVGLYNSSQDDLRYGLGGVLSSDYEEIRTGFTLTVGRPITDYTRVFVGLKAENINVEPQQYNYLEGSSRSVTGTIRTDTRDNVFNPTTGRYDTASLEKNGGILGGDFNYEKLTVDLRRFYPVRDKQVFGIRLRMGLGRHAIPRFDYYDLGGVNTIRGYDEYQFSGTKMLLYNAEYRFVASGNLSIVVFGDAGKTWMNFDDIDPNPKKMAKSVGAGLRLKIPALGMGPIRLDYAYAFSTKKPEIHFGFGHMF